MGTFVGIVGKTEVPKEHLETYVKQMLTVWKYGGMMQYRANSRKTMIRFLCPALPSVSRISSHAMAMSRSKLLFSGNLSQQKRSNFHKMRQLSS